MLNTHFHLVAKVRKGGSNTSTRRSAFIAGCSDSPLYLPPEYKSRALPQHEQKEENKEMEEEEEADEEKEEIRIKLKRGRRNRNGREREED
jgi:predicted small lipoprotein YifL